MKLTPDELTARATELITPLVVPGIYPHLTVNQRVQMALVCVLLARELRQSEPVVPLPAGCIEADGWKSWGGGARPVSRGVMVECVQRNGVRGREWAELLRWIHDGGDCNIIAYRVVPPYPED